MTVYVPKRAQNQCHWVLGDPRDLLCCGEPTEGRHQYCPEHKKLSLRDRRGRKAAALTEEEMKQ